MKLVNCPEAKYLYNGNANGLVSLKVPLEAGGWCCNCNCWCCIIILAEA